MQMEPTLRTFCVIPHEARDNDYFDAVFEDGVRALHQGRLHTLFFSRVLSPAHDIAGYVVGPLLARVRQGGNVALIIALPEDMEREEGNDDTNTRRKKYASDAGSSASGGEAVVSGEKLDVALELYSHFLPLLFRSAQQCCFARVSVVTFATNGKRVYDVLQGCEVRSERQAQYQLIEREGSSERWGAIMQLLLHERHAQLEQDGALSAEGVLAVRVELEGYGTVVVAEVGSEKGTLHHLTLLLRSGGACGGKTYPPRGPLSGILREVTPPAGLVHIVGIPDPRLAPRGTMRLLRFMSSLCNASAAASPQPHGEVEKASHEPSPLPICRDAIIESTSATSTNKKQQQVPHPYAWGEELFVDPSQCARGLPTGHFATNATSTWDWGASRPEHLCKDSSAAFTTAGATNAVTKENPSAPPSSSSADCTAPHTSREQALVSRAAALDRTNRELTAALSEARAEVRHMQSLHHSSQEALRQKQDALLAMTASSQKTTRENVDYTNLVPKLLRKIKVLEKERNALQQAAKGSESQFNDMQCANKRLQEQLQRLQNEVRTMTKKETQRLREQALNRIGSEGEEAKRIVTKATKTTSPGRTRGATKPETTETSRPSRSCKVGRAESNLKLLDTIADLQRRNALLEADVRVLRQSASVAISDGCGGNRRNNVQGISDANKDAGGKQEAHCATCESMRHQLQHVSDEVDRSRKERVELQRLLADRPVVAPFPSPATVRDAVEVVSASLISGCESLRAQLGHLEAEAQRQGQRGTQHPSFPNRVFREHMDAISALEAALQDISSRRYLGTEMYERVVSTSATAADAEHLSNLLSFEVERCTHLRAFVPTFAQLAVATEHMKMRVLPVER